MPKLGVKPLAPQTSVRVPKRTIVYPGFQVTELGLREVKPHTQDHRASGELHQHASILCRCVDLSS